MAKESKAQPGMTAARKSERVGSSYPEERYNNPLNAGIDHWYDDGDGKKSLVSPSRNTVDHAGVPLIKGRYEKLFEGK